MKRKLIVSLALSALLLSACDTDDTQTAETEQPGTTVFVTEKEAPEISADAPEAVQTEPASSVNVSFQFIDTDHAQDNFFVRDDLICAPKYNSNGVDYSGQIDLNFIDIVENKIIGTVPLPGGFRMHGIYPMNGNVLVKIISKGYDPETRSEVISAAVINDDLSLEIIDNAAVSDVYFEHYGHKISQWNGDLVNVDGDPEIIIPGGEDGYGLYGTSQVFYMLPIDENRFVFRTVGRLETGLGIYDLSLKTAAAIPDSEEYIPVGVHDGKIYAVRDGSYFNSDDLYTIDIETMETSLFLEFPYELGTDHQLYYYMPESGDHIVILKLSSKYSEDPEMYLADPDNAVIEYSYTFPDGYDIYNNLFFIDENRFAIGGNIDKEAKLIIVDKQDLQ